MSNWRNELATLANERITEYFGIYNARITGIRYNECAAQAGNTPPMLIVTEINNRIYVGRGATANETVGNLIANIVAETE